MKKTLLIFSCICFSGMALADNPPKIDYPWNCGCSWNNNGQIKVTTLDGDTNFTKNLCVSPRRTNDATYPKGPSYYCTKESNSIQDGGYVTCRSVSKVTWPSSGISDFMEQSAYATPKSWLLCTDAKNQNYSNLLKCYAIINPAKGEDGHWVSNTLQDNSDGTKWCCRDTSKTNICNQ